MNRLGGETSPYLLQHANTPVHWWPWGEEALAEAQRAFLETPPGKAYLHPRFWAPFVVLGDGLTAPVQRPSGAPSVTSVERMTQRGGEVLSVRRTRNGVISRLVSEPDANGRRGAETRLSGVAPWRRDDSGGAMTPAVDLGDVLVIGGYRADSRGRIVPTLDTLDRTTGARLRSWLGEADGVEFSAVFDLIVTAPNRALVLTGDAVRLDGRASALRILEIDATLQPRLLFEIPGSGRNGLDAATLSLAGGDLVITYTDRSTPLIASPALPGDDYDFPLCASEPVTWIERRDPQTGRLRTAREVRGLQVEVVSLRGRDILLGGAVTATCGAEAQGVVLALDPHLGTRTFWRDNSLGQSIVWSLGALPSGRLVVAASKQAVVDLATPLVGGRQGDIYRIRDVKRANGGMVVVLDRKGQASAPRMLDSGIGVFVNDMDTTLPGDILLGGSLGGEAAIFHLADTPGPKP